MWRCRLQWMTFWFILLGIFFRFCLNLQMALVETRMERSQGTNVSLLRRWNVCYKFTCTDSEGHLITWTQHFNSILFSKGREKMIGEILLDLGEQFETQQQQTILMQCNLLTHWPHDWNCCLTDQWQYISPIEFTVLLRHIYVGRKAWICAIHGLCCAKHGFAQSMDCTAQSVDPRFAQTIHGSHSVCAILGLR